MHNGGDNYIQREAKQTNVRLAQETPSTLRPVRNDSVRDDYDHLTPRVQRKSHLSSQTLRCDTILDDAGRSTRVKKQVLPHTSGRVVPALEMVRVR